MASIKGNKALSPALMRVDGNGAFITDKVKLGASPGVATPVAADTIDFLLPAGSELCTLESYSDALDTGAALLYSVGYRPVDGTNPAASTAYFAAAGQTAHRAAVRAEYSFKPIKFDYDVYISFLIGTAQAGITAGNELHIIAGINQVGPK
jgi:hypothetical protein